MDKNNLKSFMGRMNELMEEIDGNQDIVINMAEQVLGGKFPFQANLQNKSTNNKSTNKATSKPPKKQHTNHKKTEDQTPTRVTRQQQLQEQQKRKQQEILRQESAKKEDEDAAKSYLQEAIILSEIMGSPVSKRRDRRRHRGVW